ncbi:MAG: SufE family protein [Bdellovibrionaceae bacterium]|nr:SufE family protein [Pseudobdellovibrionaceae bacterium]
MGLSERESEIINDFRKLSSWEDRYKKIIEIGKSLPPLAESYRTDENLVKGCQSRVWLVARLEDGRLCLHADSDALVVRGLVALLVQLYSGATPEEVLSHQPSFIRELGFEGNLSPSRANGLFSMIKQIKIYAMAFMHLKAQGPS